MIINLMVFQSRERELAEEYKHTKYRKDYEHE